MTTTEKRTMLTIVTESVIENMLLADLDRLGVRGYTVTDARGRGSRGVRDANWDEAANIRIEVICTRELAEALLAHLQKHYYANYAMVSCLHEVEVVRAEKF
ncbi:P-II family nitrogen regulator [Propionivibrio sp.]|jgi:nitrogen regulatory protein PII|uniref:P-II family nitrogen regulator n=1 Tax=Propionivibrio sp. TaxID=2212460 RepID=UPI00272E6835|nr:transcriptional regulator [Propionivibrio sp.]